MAGRSRRRFTTSGAAACPCSLLETHHDSRPCPTPVTRRRHARASSSRPTVNGFIKGLRYYRDATNTGTHTGALYSSAGTKLATVTFADTGTGWQTGQLRHQRRRHRRHDLRRRLLRPQRPLLGRPGLLRQRRRSTTPLRSVSARAASTPTATAFPDQTLPERRTTTSTWCSHQRTTTRPAVTARQPRQTGRPAVDADTRGHVDLQPGHRPGQPSRCPSRPGGPAGRRPARLRRREPDGDVHHRRTARWPGTTYKATVNANSASGVGHGQPEDLDLHHRRHPAADGRLDRARPPGRPRSRRRRP